MVHYKRKVHGKSGGFWVEITPFLLVGAPHRKPTR